MKIALAGNPNSGKTTLYNALTGKNEHAGNWAGVTVDTNESTIKKTYAKGKKVFAVDLPGAYSMSPFTNEESVTSDYIKNENLDVIINIVDSTNLSRSLFLTTQLLELEIPVVIALNKSDLSKQKTKIDAKKLGELLHCPVIETISTSAKGLELLTQKTIERVGDTQKIVFTQKNLDLSTKEKAICADKARFEFVNSIISQVEKRKVLSSEKNTQDKVDTILAHKWFGLPIFAVVMWGVFSLSQTYVGPFIAEYLTELIDNFGSWVGEITSGASPFLHSLLVDGIIGGVGALVGFLPLVMVMYFLIALLEDCGYMARVAVIMDRFFKKVGLSGKSIIPMVIGTGCSIPGVMASRTIKNERERRTTAMLTPFMPCGAKLPVIVLFARVFFENASWIGTSMYFAGILLIVLGALLVRRITGNKKKKSFFIMELPEYKIPSLKRATLSMLDRAKAFIIKAGTVILICNVIMQVMQSFNWSFELVDEAHQADSILASLASPLALLFVPLGFGVWQFAAATITGLIAKENIVGTLAVVFSITNFINTEDLTLSGGANEVAGIMGLTSVAALSFLVFNLFCPPCFAAIGAMNAELKSRKWLLGGLALQFGTGYSIAFLVYQIGTFITTGHLGSGFIGGLIAVILMAAIVVGLIIKADKDVKTPEKIKTKA